MCDWSALWRVGSQRWYEREKMRALVPLPAEETASLEAIPWRAT